MARASYSGRSDGGADCVLMSMVVSPQFSAAELKLILHALLDARVVLQAVDGGLLQHPPHPPVHLHDLSPEIARVEAALLLVTAA